MGLGVGVVGLGVGVGVFIILDPSELFHQSGYGSNTLAFISGDEIFAEHLKYASPRIAYLWARCFSGFLTHGTLPEDMISVILVPVIKDKTSTINSKDNYRPIALASVRSKVFERVLLNRLEIYLLTTDNQYGFIRKHSTDMCIRSERSHTKISKPKHEYVPMFSRRIKGV